MTAPDTPALFQQAQFRTVVARNRIMVSPMCQYSASEGVPSDWHLVHLGSRAVGGAGIVMTEATAIEPAGRISPFDLGLWNDEQEEAFARIARFVSEQGAVAGIQLSHAGRKASHSRPWEGRDALSLSDGGWETVGPSPIPWAVDDLLPRELSRQDIARIIQGFADSAKRAHRAGFQVLELHGAHGYLIDSFLSPLSNRRTDEYGGTFENRTRFLRELASEVRKVWPPEFPLFVRLSCTEWVEGGWCLADTIELCRGLKMIGVDLIDCSSGGNSSNQTVSTGPGYQIPFSEAVRREAGIATAAVGLVSDPASAERIVALGQADLVCLGRILLWNPWWPHHASAALQAGNRLPVQYERAWIHSRSHAMSPP